MPWRLGAGFVGVAGGQRANLAVGRRPGRSFIHPRRRVDSLLNINLRES